jgi:uncharacterized protein
MPRGSTNATDTPEHLGTLVELDTPHGTARVHLHPAADARAALVLGHGAGGGIAARDLVATTGAAVSVGVSVALVEQPYRVAGRRSPAPARQLDAAWTAVINGLRDGELRTLPVITGGRSAGARVACRTAADTDAKAVLCLAFPLTPPSQRSSAEATAIRAAELDCVSVPMLIVQGESDPFGTPSAGSNRAVVKVAGSHSLKSDLGAVADAVRDWLPRVI